jgi:hypothetical protein
VTIDAETRRWAVVQAMEFHYRNNGSLDDVMATAQRFCDFIVGVGSSPGSFTPASFGATPADSSGAGHQ